MFRYVESNINKEYADLKVTYTSMASGKQVSIACDTIMDFIDVMESDELDIPMLDDTNVKATFFNNRLLDKSFDTIDDLLEHCKNIVK